METEKYIEMINTMDIDDSDKSQLISFVRSVLNMGLPEDDNEKNNLNNGNEYE